ncbi:MAG: tRNA 2-thiouridine(34) synthase MnmA [Planctomycetes bacterium]|nr:tRNA 2-thiouridine(34) synthase MnmA [Planctomycetota bacterium]
MSGGVDSSVAAWLLQRQGYEVTGVFMCLGAADGQAGGKQADRRICCGSIESADDARRVAGQLGMPFYVLDFAREFDAVIDYFAAEYARGRTPNPCARCNEWLKFGKLLHYADAGGARYVATGHHARIVRCADGPAIFRGQDRAKDQSYALFGLPADVLARTLLPIGDIDSKAEVRRLARQLGLTVADKLDSQDICFMADDGSYLHVLHRCGPEALRPGPIVDHTGRQVGIHGGIGRFTVGQRRGVGVAAGVPMYVIAIDSETATVTIGPLETTMAGRLVATGANWHSPVGDGPACRLVQIRYNYAAQPATVSAMGADRFEAVFDHPVHAITPGQVAAVYEGDRLLGGGWIESGGD